MKLKGKRTVVTGGGSGYGKGIAAALVAAGAKVWVTGRDGAKLARAAKAVGATAIFTPPPALLTRTSTAPTVLKTRSQSSPRVTSATALRNVK